MSVFVTYCYFFVFAATVSDDVQLVQDAGARLQAPLDFVPTSSQQRDLGSEIWVGGSDWKVALNAAGELWVTNGTSFGTHMIRKFEDATPIDMTYLGDAVYFLVNHRSSRYGREGLHFWRTNGRADGTIDLGYMGRYPGATFVANRNLFWTGTHAYALAVVEDGFDLRTRLVSSVNGTEPLVVVEDNAVGAGSFATEVFDRLVWRSNGILRTSDGTPEGTGTALETNGSIDTLYSSQAGGFLYFRIGDDIWKSDGTNAGTNYFTNLPGVHHRSLSFNNNLYIIRELDSVVDLVRIGDRGKVQSIEVLTVIPTRLVRTGDGRVMGYTPTSPNNLRLFLSDGTANGTYNSVFVSAGEASSPVLLPARDRIYFATNSGVRSYGRSRFSSDRITDDVDLKLIETYGTRAVLKKDDTLWISEGFTWDAALLTSGHNTDEVFPLKDGFFYFRNQENGAKDFVFTDGIDPNQVTYETIPPVDIYQASDPQPVGADVLFAAGGANLPDPLQTRVWQYAGVPNNATSLGSDLPGLNATMSSALFGGRAYFSSSDGVIVSDGSSAGTETLLNGETSNLRAFGNTLLLDLPQGNAVWNGIDENLAFFPSRIRGAPLEVGDSIFARALDGLMQYNQTTTEFAFQEGRFRLGSVVDGWLYYTETTEPQKGAWVTTVYRTNGIDTDERYTFPASSVPDPGLPLGAVKDQVLIVWVDGNFETALYILDTITGDVRRSDDAALAPLYTDATNFYATPEKLFFIHTDAQHGAELWCYDGRVAFLVKDIFPGVTSSGVEFLGELEGLTAFSAVDANGREWWLTDGTGKGTFRMSDIAPGALHANPSGFISQGDAIYFAAHTSEMGGGLYAFDNPVLEFADQTLGQAAIDQNDLNDDGRISRLEALFIRSLDVSNSDVTNLDDLAAFPNLEILSAQNTRVTSLEPIADHPTLGTGADHSIQLQGSLIFDPDCSDVTALENRVQLSGATLTLNPQGGRFERPAPSMWPSYTILEILSGVDLPEVIIDCP